MPKSAIVDAHLHDGLLTTQPGPSTTSPDGRVSNKLSLSFVLHVPDGYENTAASTAIFDDGFVDNNPQPSLPHDLLHCREDVSSGSAMPEESTDMMSICMSSRSSLESVQVDAPDSHSVAKPPQSSGSLLTWFNSTSQRKRSHSDAKLAPAGSGVTVSLSKPTGHKSNLFAKRTKVDDSEGDSQGVIGISRSATASRELCIATKNGQFAPCPKKLARWKAKILELDEDAEFDKDDCRVVRHSRCGGRIRVKEPYDVTRFRAHKLQCVSSKRSSAGMPTIAHWGTKFNITMKPRDYKDSPQHKSTPSISLPCSGLSEVDESLISTYLRRTPVGGGGACSVTVIARELFKKTFGLLTKKQKQIVLDKQAHEHIWRNDHQHMRVFATNCKKSASTTLPGGRTQPCIRCLDLLNLHSFKKAIKKPMLTDKNYVHLNHCFYPKVQAEIYSKIIGVREIVESAVRTLSQ